MRKTKILCTLGPATESAAVISTLITKGADILRLNMSHASHDWVRMVYGRVREAAVNAGREIAVLMDLTGPSIRTGDVEQPWQLKVGDEVEFRCTPDFQPTKQYSCTVNYPELGKDLKPGDIILIDGGMIQVKATAVTPKYVLGTVLTQGEMKSRRHINLPGVDVRLPPLTKKDYADLDLGVELGVDYFALSFAREPGHIQHLNLLLEQKGSKARVIAKIENQQALKNIDTLVEASGGIMIARGDLGSECPIEDLPLIQRQIVERCSFHGRKVIVATQMLESMIENPVPTRAEVTDIFNAVIEQVDCVMLSGETSVGRYPDKCVEILDNVIRRIEDKYPSGRFASDAPLKTNKHKTVKAAILLANSIPGSKLLVFTLRGVMAHLLAHQRPEFAPIFAFTPKLHVSRALVSARGVQPYVMEFAEGQPDKSIRDAIAMLYQHGLVKQGDPLVILSDALYDGTNVDAILLQEA
ncbi:pyruvate kinase [Brevifollis gellanilyticus]|uniref:Pyruvate kinase n=1 Tax=Brevifollis gellanilyticus TaxID=748831 RepID=A0A512M9I7_9BACT|nr:pyruvate kinase [Brevifollis gellanilyticus]GEP43400.1 pyruvate kinase [Brevifollis gellanilyticus]